VNRRNKYRNLFLVALGALILGALASCKSGVIVTRVVANKPETHVGIPHPLLYSRYETKLGWRVVGCGEKLKVETSVSFKGPQTAPDSENLFVIDPRSLSTPFKTSDLKVTYLPSGAPVSLNASIDDKSAEVISTIAKVGVGLVKFAATPSKSSEQKMNILEQKINNLEKKKEVCSEEVVKALPQVEQTTTLVKDYKIEVDKNSKALVKLSEKIATMGDNVDEETKKALSGALDALVASKDKLEKALKGQSKTINLTSYEINLYWPSRSSLLDKQFELPDEVFKRWTTPDVNTSEKQKSTIFLSMTRLDKKAISNEIVNPRLGIPIRTGATGNVSACVGSRCSNSGKSITSREDRLQQLGEIYYLPCESRAFTSVKCSYELDDNGQLKSMGHAATGSGEKVSAALNDIISQAVEAKKIHNEAATKQLEADTAYFEAVAARSAAMEALNKEGSDPTQAEINTFTAQAERLDAERALIEAELALEEAKAKRVGE